MIRVDDDGDVRTVTLDRPERRNALTPAGLDDLERAVTGRDVVGDADSDTDADLGADLDADLDAAVVLLRGAGSAFCAGADLDAVADLADAAADGDTEPAAAFARHGQRVARAIESADAVVVAGVDGAARGGGVELALACDLRVATPDASFAEPGVTFGLFGAWGGTHRLPRVVGPTDAMDIALTGRGIDADAALRMGLVSRVVDDPRTVAEELVATDGTALQTLTGLMRATTNRHIADAAAATAAGDAAAAADSRGFVRERERAEAAAFADLVATHADALRRG